MSLQWATGQRFRLNSGGPAMTVESCSSEGVVCQWFDEGESLQTATLQPAMLVEGNRMS